MVESIADLLGRHARSGRLDWIGLRPARRAAMTEADAADLSAAGLVGDHHTGGGKRALTLIQGEHLPLIALFAKQDDVRPHDLRRNVVVSRINLAALRNREILLGAAIVRIAGPCAPCSRMEATLGFGGYNAMRGHGGWYAEIVRPGRIRVGDTVTLVTLGENHDPLTLGENHDPLDSTR